MKRMLLVLVMVAFVVYAWSETNVAPIQDKTKLEDLIRTRLRERLQKEDCDQICDKLFDRIREGSSSQDQYEYTLKFVKAYMDRKGKALNPEDLLEVGEFVQKNRNRFDGTSREKRNQMLIEAENRIRNRTQNNNDQTQLAERLMYSYSYQNRMRQGNISENAIKATMMRQRRNNYPSDHKR